MSESTTIAARIAARFDNDGRNFSNDDAEMFDQVCQQERPEVLWRDGEGTGVYTYVFKDGSSLVVTDDQWDHRIDECNRFCAEGNKRCTCPTVVSYRTNEDVRQATPRDLKLSVHCDRFNGVFEDDDGEPVYLTGCPFEFGSYDLRGLW